MTSARLTVELGSRAYDIHIGAALLERAGQILAPHLNRLRTFVVADRTVHGLHGARLAAGLGAEGVAAEWIVLPPGEQTKSFAMLDYVVDRLIALGADRRDLVLAFGGGVVGDLAGFASAIMKRGCAFAQIPTTLLAQVDSAVGGKTAINIARGKNLVGVFHQPVAVIADLDVLGTLPPREMRAGYAEVVKYGALGDRAFFERLESAAASLLAGDRTIQSEAVARCCALKAAIVARDETETGERALLNLGHTFGHALETAYGHADLLHGEAVAAGMGLAFDYSVERGECSAEEAERFKAHLRSAGLPSGLTDLPDARALSADALLEAMTLDKKALGGRITLILVRSIGSAFIAQGEDASRIRDFLSRKLAAG
ncbi:MAG: 3-dehydroquinate synthase [Parvularculaceae bacterium]|nr:3-dehydroquinate synthase [Parvularculaceae bacterium]